MIKMKSIPVLVLFLLLPVVSAWVARPNRSDILVASQSSPEAKGANDDDSRSHSSLPENAVTEDDCGSHSSQENATNVDDSKSHSSQENAMAGGDSKCATNIDGSVDGREKEEVPSKEELYFPLTPRRLGSRLRSFRYKSWLRIRDYFRMERNQMTAQERNIVNIYKRTLPAVAELKVYHEYKEYQGELPDDKIPGIIDTVSGFLWDYQGHVVTAYHCLYSREHFIKVKVRLPGMVDFCDAEVVGSDNSTDLAVLKISSQQYNPALSNPLELLPKPIPKGTSRFLQVGQSCLAIGVPYSRSDSLTMGMVTGLNRRVESEGNMGPISGCLQTDGEYFHPRECV